MKTLKLSYRSMWPDHNPYKIPRDFFLYTLEQHYSVIIDNNEPDVVVYSVFGPVPKSSEYPSDPLMIAYSGESYDCQGPCDLNFGFDINTDENYHRLPIWALYINWDKNNRQDHPLHIDNITQRHLVDRPLPEKFCNFTYRNPVRSRIEFFLALNSRNKVDSTGPLYNNTGVLLADKPLALQNYKFTIAFENKQQTGYVTEKLLEPLAAGSIPIYHGAEFCTTDFNPASFINSGNFQSQNQLLDYIEQVTTTPELWLKYFREPVFLNLPDIPSTVFDAIYHKLVTKKSRLEI